MASETPGARRAAAARARRKATPNASADTKYYASGQASVFGARRGSKPKPIKSPTQSINDKSADKYYAVGGSNRARHGKRLLHLAALRQSLPDAKRTSRSSRRSRKLVPTSGEPCSRV
jgi:hypothetical protein